MEIHTKEIRLSDVAAAARSSVKDAPTGCQRYFSRVMNVSAAKIHGEGECQIMLLGTSDRWSNKSLLLHPGLDWINIY